MGLVLCYGKNYIGIFRKLERTEDGAIKVWSGSKSPGGCTNYLSLSLEEKLRHRAFGAS